MHAGYGLFLCLVLVRLSVRTNQDALEAYFLTITGDYDVRTDDESLAHDPLTTSTPIEPSRFFRNEPVPLASSVVDDLTALASVVYALSVVILLFIFLAWITHYHAPCSSVITSVLSTITGLPEPIIRSVALCGSCCIWCEGTWLFRRIHQFNVCVSTRVRRFTSVTCKLMYDTICPCCQPPDTPSQRSIIGTLDYFLDVTEQFHVKCSSSRVIASEYHRHDRHSRCSETTFIQAHRHWSESALFFPCLEGPVLCHCRADVCPPDYSDNQSRLVSSIDDRHVDGKSRFSYSSCSAVEGQFEPF